MKKYEAAHKRARAKYNATPKGREANRRKYAKWRASTKGKNWRKVWNSSARGEQSLRAGRLRFNRTPRGVYQARKNIAAVRGLVFELSFEQFMAFWQKACAYCGIPTESCNLDRVDNSLGYLRANVVPCCLRCNKMKLTWSKEDFIEHCRRIVERADFGDLV